MINPHNDLPIERVGTTGSRKGPVTREQANTARWFFQQLWPFKELHQGCCVGWDEWATMYVRSMWGPYEKGGVQIHAWPPIDRKLLSQRALDLSDVIHEPREYKTRDRDIVWHTQVLVSGPAQHAEVHHGGTWYTMRQGLAMLRPIYFIRRDGELVTGWKSEMNERVKDKEYEELVRTVVGRRPHDEGEEALLLTMNRRLAQHDLPTVGIDETLGDDVFEVRPYDPGDLSDVFG